MIFSALADTALTVHLAFNGWLLAPLFLIAVGLVIWLYHAQQRIASRWVIVTLTAIRTLLLVLMMIVLLQPALRWTRTTHSAGTLWLMLDDSQSMTMIDPQATPVERLRWADALGLLPEDMRTARPDYQLANLICLRQELFGMRPVASAISGVSSPDDPAQVQKFIAGLKEWRVHFKDALKELSKDPALAANSAIMESLERAARLVDDGQNSAAGQSNQQYAAALMPWSIIQSNYDAALRDLKLLADQTDEAFLRDHQTDTDVQSALRHIGQKSRADLACDLLTTTSKRTGKNLADIIPTYQTKLADIGNSAHVVDNVDEWPAAFKNALAPTTESTNLAAGFSLVGQQITGDEPASVIVISDGRQTVKDDPIEATRLLASRGVKVYTLMVGSRQVSPDAAVDQVDPPDWIYKDDTMRATARIRLDGMNGRRVKVDFLRGADVLDTQYVTAQTNEETQTLAFNDKPPEAPGYEYTVRVEDVPGEVNHENNRQSFHVAIKKDKLYALIVDDQPRWEFRYLAAYMGRDTRVKLQSVLLHPAQIEDKGQPPKVQASPTNPKIEAQILPQTKDDWQAFDLIVLGDISPDTLSNAQQQYLAAAVRDRGTTLIVIAGQHNMPDSFANTPLADLLPVTLGNSWPANTMQAHMATGFRPAVAPAAGDSTGAVLSRLGIDDESNAQLWSKVPNWYWHSQQTIAKSNASVIWYIADLQGPSTGVNDDVKGFSAAKNRALLAAETLGLGRVLYLASDQTWRLREFEIAGQNIQDRFWGQVIRWAVGNDLPAGGRFVRFGANRPKYQQGDPLDPVIVTAHVLHEDLTPNSGQSFKVIAKLRPAASDKSAAGQSRQVGSATMVESAQAPGYYKASLGNLPAGDIELSLQGPEVERLLTEDPTVTQKTILVKLSPQMDLEQRNMNTDPKMMATLAQLGGGFALDGPYADVLAAHLPQIHRTITHVEQIGFFGDPKDRYTYIFHLAFMGLFVLLIAAEWIIRKFAGMV